MAAVHFILLFWQKFPDKDFLSLLKAGGEKTSIIKVTTLRLFYPVEKFDGSDLDRSSMNEEPFKNVTIPFTLLIALKNCEVHSFKRRGEKRIELFIIANSSNASENKSGLEKCIERENAKRSYDDL